MSNTDHIKQHKGTNTKFIEAICNFFFERPFSECGFNIHIYFPL